MCNWCCNPNINSFYHIIDDIGGYQCSIDGSERSSVLKIRKWKWWKWREWREHGVSVMIIDGAYSTEKAVLQTPVSPI